MNIAYSIKQGDLVVFNQVFEQYHQKLYFYVLSKTKSSFCAEEVTQITFIKLWQYRHSLNEEISIDVQLFRIAKTTLIDQLRKANSSEKLLSLLERTDVSFNINNAITNSDREELHQKLQKLLLQMPPMRRKVFEMSRLQGLSYKEIAKQQSVSVKTVENHINHALKQVRKTLSEMLALFIF